MASPLDYVPVPTDVADGLLLQVTATTSGGAHTLFTATAATQDQWDSAFVSAVNNTDTDVLLTIEWGGTGLANEVKKVVPPYSGMIPIVPIQRLRNAKVVKVYADTASAVNVYVDADRLKDSDG